MMSQDAKRWQIFLQASKLLNCFVLSASRELGTDFSIRAHTAITESFTLAKLLKLPKVTYFDESAGSVTMLTAWLGAVRHK